MRKKRYKYNFAGKKEAQGGKISLIYAGLSFVCIVASFLSVYMGFSETTAGVVGLAATLLAVVGFFTGLSSLHESLYGPGKGALGAVLNGLLAVIWIGLYLAGIN